MRADRQSRAAARRAATDSRARKTGLSRILNLDAGGFNDARARVASRVPAFINRRIILAETRVESAFSLIGGFVNVKYSAIREFVVKKYRRLFGNALATNRRVTCVSAPS
jgi:hypothetical protein